jgi:hypothetical protein
MNKRNVIMTAVLTAVLAMIGTLALGGCSGNSPGDPLSADTTALNAAISAAETAKADVVVNTAAANVPTGTKWVTQAELTALETALAAAQAVADNADASQTQVDEAATTLTAAAAAFNASKKEGAGYSAADTATLTAAISAAGTAKAGVVVNTAAVNVAVGTQWVTQTELTAFETALAAAQAVAANTGATQAQVDGAVATLSAATAAFTAAKKDGAKPPPADTAVLTAAISAAATAKAGVTVATAADQAAAGTKWVTQAEMTALETALAAAQAVADNADATQAQVNEAAAALTTATGTFNAAKQTGANDDLAAAAAFTSAHGATVNKALTAVAVADKPAVEAAIAAYDALSAPAKAALPADTPTKLQTLLARINNLINNVGTADATKITLDFKADGALLAPPESLSISRGSAGTLTVTAASDFTNIRWSLGGAPIDAPRGAAQSIDIAAANYPAGQYLLGLAAQKGGVEYSTELTFTVTE